MLPKYGLMTDLHMLEIDLVVKVKVWLSGQIIDASGNASNLWVIEAEGFRKELVLNLSITLDDIISQIKSGQIQIPATQTTQPSQTQGEIDI